jgi:ABC-type multidrug transport system fused ATPase/permease subunit
MEDGRIIEQGGHATLLAKGGSYADLCSSQLIATATNGNASPA